MFKWLSVAFFLFCASCGQSPNQKELFLFKGNAMTMDYRILVAAPSHAVDLVAIEQTILKTFYLVHRVYNKWNLESELSLINQAPALTKLPISKELHQLLEFTDHMVHLTQGKFDPTIEPLQQLWKAALKEGTCPSNESIEDILSYTGWDKIILEADGIVKKHAAVRLDLGGIAKGYAVDLLIEALNKEGFFDLYVEWGGEIRTLGQHPARRPWRVYISCLEDTDPHHALQVVDLTNESIATSGDYLQNWTIEKNQDEKKSYFHIFDPKTGYPLEKTVDSICSASVKAPSCALADGLATAAMMFTTLEEAKAWSKEVQKLYPTAEFWLTNRSKLGLEAQLINQDF